MDSYKMIAPSIKTFDSYPDSYHRDAFDSYHRDSLDSYAHSKFDSYLIGVCVCGFNMRNPTTPPRPRDHELVKQMRHAAQPHLPAHKIRSTCSTQHQKGEIINWRWQRGTYTY